MQVISCTSLMLIPIPMMLYQNAVFEFRSKCTVPLIFTVSIANIVISWALHFLHIKDIREMLTFSHVTLLMGARSELLSQLAYIDGLTGIGNRTAFEEKLAELEEIKDEVNGIGIAMFDLNNLKQINDNLGHQYGDKAIEKSARLITDAFEPENGKCFRIGGDEFVVLLSGDNVQTRYEKGIKSLISAQSSENSRADSRMKNDIAYGFGMYQKNSDYHTLNDVFRQADLKMYEKKKEIKANQS